MRYLLLALALVATACSPTVTCEQLGNCPRDGGVPKGDVGAPEPFELKVLDPHAAGGSLAQLSLAVSGEKLGVTYFAESTGADGGVLRELRYVEYSEAAPSPTPEVVAKVVRTYGTALAYDSTGKPYVGFLGAPGNNGNYWYEGSPNVATRTGATWTSAAVYTLFDNVVGLWPAVAVDPVTDTVYTAGRNIGFGQFAVQGAEKTNIEFVEGVGGAGWTQTTAVRGFCPNPPNGCVDQTEGHGGYNQMVVPADGRPLLFWAGLGPNELEPATGIYLVKRNEDKTWPGNVVKVRSTGNMGGGPAIAYKNGAGYLVSYFEQNQIKLLESPDALDWNKAPDIVVGAGTIDKANAVAWTDEGFPAVVYYQCSERSGVTFPCPEADDELMLAWRVDGDVWQRVKVDHAGGHFMKLAYWKNRAVIAYKDTKDQTLKLAIQR
ncbi:MAG TPA: hypothetical protein VGK67_17885 [Myxococcales bacterium]|jgi:hypothetical protein